MTVLSAHYNEDFSCEAADHGPLRKQAVGRAPRSHVRLKWVVVAGRRGPPGGICRQAVPLPGAPLSLNSPHTHPGSLVCSLHALLPVLVLLDATDASAKLSPGSLLHRQSPPRDGKTALFGVTPSHGQGLRLALPAQATFTFVVRSFTVLDGIGKCLDPRFDISEIAAPYARELLLEGRPQVAKLRSELGKRLALQARRRPPAQRSHAASPSALPQRAPAS